MTPGILYLRSVCQAPSASARTLSVHAAGKCAHSLGLSKCTGAPGRAACRASTTPKAGPRSVAARDHQPNLVPVHQGTGW